MSTPDASKSESVAAGAASDAFGARPDASGRLATARRSVEGERVSLGKKRRAEGKAARAVAPPARSARSYLVTVVPLDEVPIERRIVRKMVDALGPVLDGCIGTDLDLGTLNLTSPDDTAVRQMAALLAAEVEQRPGEGVFLVRDVGPQGGREHFHGLALSTDLAALRAGWCTLVRADTRGARGESLKFWPIYRSGAHDGRFLPHLIRALHYAFKQLPAGVVPRDLDADVIASGPFASPWQSARTALDAPPRHALGSAAACRVCQRAGCGGEVPATKRSHARYCSPACRKAASARRRAHQIGSNQEPGAIGALSASASHAGAGVLPSRSHAA